MSVYKPSFICPYCGKELPAIIASAEQGLLGACDCEDSRRESEMQHRIEIERRKKSRGRRRAR